MSWLTDIVRPSIKTSKKRTITAEVWQKCPSCGGLIYENDLESSLFTCTHCGHHLRWGLSLRLGHLLAQGATEIAVKLPKDDPLKFKDRKPYTRRLKEAREETGQPEAFRVVTGSIQGQPVVVVALDFEFMAGSMSRAVGAAMVAGVEYAIKHGLPLLAITASGGARMQESMLSLMQMARTTAAIVQLKQAGLPYVVLLTDPTTGGVTASFAMQGDVLIAEPGALIGFAGPRVIEQTIRQTLPEGFQRAEYLLAHGMVDMVTPRREQPAMLARILGHLTAHKRGGG